MTKITEQELKHNYTAHRVNEARWQEMLTRQRYDDMPLIFAAVVDDEEQKILRKVMLDDKNKIAYYTIYEEKIQDEPIDEGLDPDDFPVAVFDNLYKRRYDPIVVRVYLQDAYDEDKNFNDEIKKYNEENQLVQRTDFIKKEEMGVRVIYLTPHILKENNELELFTNIKDKRYRVSLMLQQVMFDLPRYLIPRAQSEYCYGCSFAFNQQVITARDLGLKINDEDFKNDLLLFQCNLNICAGLKKKNIKLIKLKDDAETH